MNDTDQHAIHSSSESNWRTPDPLFYALEKEFHFYLDAAATEHDRKCATYFGPDHQIADLRDALQVDWYEYITSHDRLFTGRYAIFLNPPFSREEYRKTHNPAMLIDNWARKCWEESRKGCTIVAVMPFAPQTEWYRQYVYGHIQGEIEDGRYPTTWSGHAAQQERRLPHRISFLRPDGGKAQNAGVNSAVIVWSPMRGVVGPWQPHSFYWTYRAAE